MKRNIDSDEYYMEVNENQTCYWTMPYLMNLRLIIKLLAEHVFENSGSYMREGGKKSHHEVPWPPI